jgi:hypothetical protein
MPKAKHAALKQIADSKVKDNVASNSKVAANESNDKKDDDYVKA